MLVVLLITLILFVYLLSYSTTLLLYSPSPLLLYYSPSRLLDYSNISCIDDNVNIVRLGSIACIKSVIRRCTAPNHILNTWTSTKTNNINVIVNTTNIARIHKIIKT